MSLAGSSTETFNPQEIFSGSQEVVTTVDTLAAGQGVLPRGQVLARNSTNGLLVAAALGGPNDTDNAIKVLVHELDTDGGDIGCQTYEAGTFDPDLLVWDASYTTDAEKLAAFDGKPINIMKKG